MKKIISLLLSLVLVITSISTSLIMVSAAETYNEVPNQRFWGKLSSSQEHNRNVQSLFDGTLNNYWYYGAKQNANQWIAIDLGDEINLNAIQMISPKNADGSAIKGTTGATLAAPTAYDLYYANDGGADYSNMRGVTWTGNTDGVRVDPAEGLAAWTKIGSYTSANEKATFDAVKCRYLFIKLTAAAETQLGIGEFKAFSPDVIEPVSFEDEYRIDRSSWAMKWWQPGLYPYDTYGKNMIDGDLSTVYANEGNTGDKLPWAMFDLGDIYNLNRIAMVYAYPDKNYMPEKVNIYTSYDSKAYEEGKDSSAWQLVAENVALEPSYLDVTFEKTSARYFMIKTSDIGSSFDGASKPRTWIKFGEVYAYEDEDMTIRYDVPKDDFWAKVSHSKGRTFNASALFNGTNDKYWETDEKQKASNWVAIDLGAEIKVNGIKLDAATDSNGNALSGYALPTAFDLYYATDGADYDKLVGITKEAACKITETVDPDLSAWKKIGSYEGTGKLTSFSTKTARYLLVDITEAADTKVAIGEFNAYSPSVIKAIDYKAEENYLDTKGFWTLKAWQAIVSANKNNMVDGVLTNTYSDGGNMSNWLPWVIVDMGESVALERVVMEYAAPNHNDIPDKLNVYASNDSAAYTEGKDSSAWTLVAENVETAPSSFDSSFTAIPARYFMIKTAELGTDHNGNTKDWISFGELYAYGTEIVDPEFFEIPNNYFWAKSKRAQDGSLNLPALFDGKLGYDENYTEKGYWQYSRSQTQNTNQWIAFDLGNEHKLKGIFLEDSNYNAGTPPTRYNLYVSTDGTDYAKLLGEPGGQTGNPTDGPAAVDPTVANWTFVGNYSTGSAGSKAKFDEIDARYVLVVPSEAANNYMTIDEFHAYSAEEVTYDWKEGALDASSWMIRSWLNGTSTKYNTEKAAASGACSATQNPWVMIDLGSEYMIDRLVLGNQTPNSWYTPSKVDIYTATDATAYTSTTSDKWTLVRSGVEIESNVMDVKFAAKNARYIMIMPRELHTTRFGTRADWVTYYQFYAYESDGTSAINVSEIGFYNNNNEATDVVGNVASVKANVIHNTNASDYDAEKAYTAVLIAAQYNGGRLVKVDASPVATLIDGNNDIGFNITVDSKTTGCKLFLFDSLSGMVPYVKNVSIGQ